MTDRVQPGAIDSIVRNDELSQVFGQFSSGWIVDGTTPTPAAERRADIDATALAAFDLTATTNLEATIAPGEAFVGGWCVRDQSTSLTLPANSSVTVVVGWTPDVIYDPQIHSDRDQADATIVDLAQNVNDNYPVTAVWELTTDGSGVTGTTDRRDIGPTVTPRVIDIGDELRAPVFQSLSDVPTLPEGTLVYVADEQQLYVEDGT